MLEPSQALITEIKLDSHFISSSSSPPPHPPYTLCDNNFILHLFKEEELHVCCGLLKSPPKNILNNIQGVAGGKEYEVFLKSTTGFARFKFLIPIQRSLYSAVGARTLLGVRNSFAKCKVCFLSDLMSDNLLGQGIKKIPRIIPFSSIHNR